MQIKVMRTKDEKRNPIEISVEDQEKALLAWAGRMEPLSYQGLGHDMDKASDIEWKGGWAFARPADALIQKMRKAGLLTLDRGRGWYFTESGRQFIRDLAEKRKGGVA